MKKATLLLTISFCLISNVAFANDSVSYSLLQDILSSLDGFITNLYQELGNAFRGIFSLLLTGYLIFTGLNFTGRATRQINTFEIMKEMAILLLSYNIAFNSSIFINWIYHPILDVMMAVPSFVVRVSAVAKESGGGSLQSMFSSMDQSIAHMVALGEDMASEGGLIDFMQIVNGVILKIVYFALLVVYFYCFSLGLISAHIILAIAPIAIALAAFKGTRHIFFTFCRTLMNYSLIPTFAAIAMALTLFLLQDLVANTESIMAEGGDAPGVISYYAKALLVGVGSIFFHLKATEYASQITGGGTSNFGNVFGSMIAAGAMSYKGVASAAKGITATAAGDTPGSVGIWGHQNHSIQQYKGKK